MGNWVGIDGGGTRTTVVVLGDDGAVLSRVVGGASLVNPVDPLAGVPALAELVREALASAAGAHAGAGVMPQPGAAGVTPQAAADGLCCALAGAGRPAVREAIAAALRDTGVAAETCVIGDAEAALFDAFGDRAGALLVAGTGSAAWARSPDGTRSRSGGWGMLLGDEGSGYAIGIEALRAVVRAEDGRQPPTALRTAVLTTCSVEAVDDLVRWTAAAGKADIAALAPYTVAIAEAGDRAARRIVMDAARALAVQVHAAVKRAGPWKGTVEVALTGGLVAPGGPLRDVVWRSIRSLSRSYELRDEPVDAARGAACIARARR